MDVGRQKTMMATDERLERRQNLNRQVFFGNDKEINDNVSCSQRTSKKKLYPLLEELFKKKGSAREKALRTLVDEFEKGVYIEFAEKNFVTLLHRCRTCLKRGTALEIDLALRLIGLLVLTLGEGDEAHEVFEELLVFLPQLLQSKLSHSVKVIECLSIVTFIAASNFVDTERSMELIWQFFMNQELKSKGIKHPLSVTAAATSAWSLLLSDINNWRIGHQKWKGLIPYLLKQIEQNNEDVNAACIEAIALIFEVGSLEKFSNQAEEYASIKEMKEDILKHVQKLCVGTEQDASKILEDDYDKTTTLTICGTKLTISTWSRLKQISYLRRFLGYGFTNHMRENKYLQYIFRFVPATTCSDIELYKPEFEEVVVRVFVPDVRREDCAKRMHVSSSSLLDKGRTVLMNKYRSLAKESKDGYFTADEELD